MIKNCVHKLTIEKQIAHRGYLTWEDILNLLDVFPVVRVLLEECGEESISDLRERMFTQGYTISYESYKRMEVEYMERLRKTDELYWKELMFS